MTGESPFPRSFWTANGTELFERAAYYAMASFVVIYLGQLGFGAYWPSTLNSVLWFLVYFLPILSGSLADQYGFKASLLVAFLLLAVAYFFMGFPVWFGGARLMEAGPQEVTVGWRTVVPIVGALVMIGVGGSIVKPCIAGTVQKTAGARKTLGFGIFYMIINVGSLTGRLVSFAFRRRYDLTAIFGVSMLMATVAFLVVLFLYRDPDVEMGTPKKPARSLVSILAGLFNVLRNGRFAMFLVVSSGFYFIYNQVYNLLPLGSLFIVLTVALIAFGELFAAARLFEYIGSLAPAGQEGLFLGYANIPMAVGSLVGGPAGAYLFNVVMCRGAVKLPSGLLKLEPPAAALGWCLLAGIGLASALSMFAYNAWLRRQAPVAA